MAMDLDLGKQVGPLPLGAWVIVVGGGLGIAVWTRRTNSTPTEPMEDVSGTPGVGVGGWTTQEPSGNPNKDDGTIPQGPPVTNEEWGRRAVNWLIAQGYNPTLADSTIRKVLAVEKLSISEYALYSIVLAHFGMPPIPLPPAPAPDPIPKPVPKPPPPKPVPGPHPKPKPPPKPKPVPKPKVRYYTVVHNDNLSKIAMKFYHRPDWQRIYNANKKGVRRADGSTGMIQNPNLIYAGWKLIIP